jgi:hypothetical protein
MGDLLTYRPAHKHLGFNIKWATTVLHYMQVCGAEVVRLHEAMLYSIAVAFCQVIAIKLRAYSSD